MDSIPHTPLNNYRINFDNNPYHSATKTVQFKVTPATSLKRPRTDENTPHKSFFRAQPWKKPKNRHAPTSGASEASRSPLESIHHPNSFHPSIPTASTSYASPPCTPTPRPSQHQGPKHVLPIPFSHNPTHDEPRCPTVKRLTDKEKRAKMYQALKECGWTFGDFLWHMSYHEGASDRAGHEPWHAQVMSKFLQGKTAHTPIEIINLWFTSHYGALPRGTNGFVFDTPYLKIPHIRLALMAMAAQLVEKKVKLEARKAVQPDAGLHATLKKKGSHKMEWKDVGATTVWEVGELLKGLQPTTWRLLEGVAGAKKGCSRRPLDVVRLDFLCCMSTRLTIWL